MKHTFGSTQFATNVALESTNFVYEREREKERESLKNIQLGGNSAPGKEFTESDLQFSQILLGELVGQDALLAKLDTAGTSLATFGK